MSFIESRKLWVEQDVILFFTNTEIALFGGVSACINLFNDFPVEGVVGAVILLRAVVLA